MSWNPLFTGVADETNSDSFDIEDGVLQKIRIRAAVDGDKLDINSRVNINGRNDADDADIDYRQAGTVSLSFNNTETFVAGPGKYRLEKDPSILLIAERWVA